MTEGASFSAAQLARALDDLPEGIQILSPTWTYLYVSEAVVKHGRTPREQLLGRTMQECYPGIETTPLFAALERCMRDRVADAFENEFTYPDGSRAWFELLIRPSAAGLIVISRDVTERKKAELRLSDAHAQALRDLVTPLIRLHAGVLLAPLIGAFDPGRLNQLTEELLPQVEAEAEPRVVIFDVSGMGDLDTAAANNLLEVTAMLHLLGATVILTGVAPSAARAVAQLGVDLSRVLTTQRLAEGIALALGLVGRRIVPTDAPR